MNLIKKTVLFYKKDGLIKTFQRFLEKICEIISRFPMRIEEKLLTKKYINEIAMLSDAKQVFVLIPCIDWHIPLFQRPHQIASELAKRENTFVLFISDQYRYDNFAGTEKIQDNFFLFSWHLAKQLDAALSNAKNVTVIMSWMRQSHLLQQFHYNKLVYEYIDDMSLFYYHTSEMEQQHIKLMQKADLTVCTASVLYENAKPYAKKAILCPNAGDYSFFHSNREAPVNSLIADKIKNFSCVIGYYGCLASWFDYDLILEVAERKPDWCFVFIGYCFDGTSDILKQSKYNNIINVPAQPYVQLPSFVSAFDIQCIPFVINDITLSTSPVKLFEYMASGKPILTSALPECLKYSSVWTYKDATDFIMKVEQLVRLKDNAKFLNHINDEALQNTWESRVDEILNEIF